MGKVLQSISAIRWSDKNRAYLTKIGYLDGRSGKKKNDNLNLNHFVNECVTTVLEEHRTPTANLVNDELLLQAFLEMQKGSLMRDINRTSAKLRQVHKLLDDLEANKAVAKEVEQWTP